jgi:hypothetical protein
VTPRPNLGETSGFSRGSPWVRAARRRGDGPRAARTCGRKRRMRPAGSPICGGGRAARSRAGGDRPRTRNSTSSRTGNASGYTISTPMPRWCVTPEHERGGRARRRRATVFSIGSPEPRLGTRETVGPACVFIPHALLFLFLLAKLLRSFATFRAPSDGLTSDPLLPTFSVRLFLSFGTSLERYDRRCLCSPAP